jgi:hypothetical protein
VINALASAKAAKAGLDQGYSGKKAVIQVDHPLKE